MEDAMWWALYRGMRRYCGEWYMREWRKTKRYWRAANPMPRYPVMGHICHLCGVPIGRPIDFSLDHIITIDQIYTEGLDVMLIFDINNLKAAHRKCNSFRSNKTLDNYPQYAKV